MRNSSVQGAFGPPGGGVIRRILLVDDSRLQRRILSASLTRDGYEVLEAGSGVEALETCRTHWPDLVLSDLVMPEMDGLAFCKAFRELSAEQYGYFILLTSKSETEEVVRGLEGGADDFLTKPVNAHELRARISAGERILRMQRELAGKNAVISETLDELRRVHDSLDRDLLEAKKLQQSLVRERFKEFPTGAVALELRSSGHVGGDLVGHYVAGDRKLGLYAIDVSGHGISSALMTARLAGYLSSSLPEQNVALCYDADGQLDCFPPARVVSRLNRIILDEMETELYFTMFVAVVDLNSGEVEMVQAGHPHPVILREGGEIEQSSPGGFPVGLIEDAEFSSFSTTLAPGDRLLILSDGVTECPDAQGVMLGESGLTDLMSGLGQCRFDEFLQSLIAALADYAEPNGFPDDISGVLFEFRGCDQSRRP